MERVSCKSTIHWPNFKMPNYAGCKPLQADITPGPLTFPEANYPSMFLKPYTKQPNRSWPQSTKPPQWDPPPPPPKKKDARKMNASRGCKKKKAKRLRPLWSHQEVGEPCKTGERGEGRGSHWRKLVSVRPLGLFWSLLPTRPADQGNTSELGGLGLSSRVFVLQGLSSGKGSGLLMHFSICARRPWGGGGGGQCFRL